jgi:hypothetical protein
VSVSIRFYAQFTASKVGVTPGSAPTVDVYAIARSNNAVTHIQTAQATTGSLDVGIYFYTLTGADLTANEYVAILKTTDSSVDLQQIPMLLQVAYLTDQLTGNTPQTGDAFARIGVAGAGLTNLGDTRIANLDATVSSRVATSGLPSHFGTLSIDTSGRVVLAPAGLDAIPVETGVNYRQAMSPVLAAVAGVLSGAAPGGGVITIKAGNDNTTTRVSADTDANGNRSSVTLSLPT